MTNKELDKLHLLLIMITEEIKRICEENEITFSLTGGSMLGAIRHKGFIPWDDDMDIAMLRDDYDKFLMACKSQLRPEFEIQTIENDEHYFYGFAKILLKNTYLEQYCHENTRQRKGIYVDIFPLDNVPENKKDRIRQSRVNYVLIKMLERKGGVGIEDRGNIVKFFGFHAIDVLNSFFSMDYLKKKLVANMIMYNSKITPNVCNMGGYYGYERETTLRSYFEKTIEVPFEHTSFPVISEYHAFLTAVYGDYMKLPPKEKRHTHGFSCLDFGVYNDIEGENFGSAIDD